MKYLTTSQYKLDKSVARGYKTVGLNLAPDVEASITLRDKTLKSMCAMSGTCADVCLAKTGMNVFPAGTRARAVKTREWQKDPKQFIAKVSAELTAIKKTGVKLAVRPNLLSDQPALAHGLAKLHPDVQFYDYTKLPKPRGRFLDNYHLTYSVSERTTRADLLHCLNYGVNMAIVTPIKKDAPLPKRMKVMGQWLPCVDGDKDDLRFLDPEGCVVLLRWKGSHQRLQEGLKGGFVIDPTQELVR